MIDNVAMEIQKAVDDKVDELIKLVDEFVAIPNAANVFGNDNNEGKKIGRNQFQTLAQAAAKASSVAEIKAYIAYQVGRQKENEGWATKCNEQTFGGQLINTINKVEKLITDGDPLAKQKRLALVERFLGFLYWKATVQGKRVPGLSMQTTYSNSEQHNNDNRNKQYSNTNKGNKNNRRA